MNRAQTVKNFLLLFLRTLLSTAVHAARLGIGLLRNTKVAIFSELTITPKAGS
jgi:hypothetical protein